jgi:hypothetical protein
MGQLRPKGADLVAPPNQKLVRVGVEYKRAGDFEREASAFDRYERQAFSRPKFAIKASTL